MHASWSGSIALRSRLTGCQESDRCNEARHPLAVWIDVDHLTPSGVLPIRRHRLLRQSLCGCDTDGSVSLRQARDSCTRLRTLEIIWYGVVVWQLLTTPARDLYQRFGIWIEWVLGSLLELFGMPLYGLATVTGDWKKAGKTVLC